MAQNRKGMKSVKLVFDAVGSIKVLTSCVITAYLLAVKSTTVLRARYISQVYKVQRDDSTDG